MAVRIRHQDELPGSSILTNGDALTSDVLPHRRKSPLIEAAALARSKSH